MQPVATGLTHDDIKAVAHYYESVSELTAVVKNGVIQSELRADSPLL
jgi:cytochrome c553